MNLNTILHLVIASCVLIGEASAQTGAVAPASSIVRAVPVQSGDARSTGVQAVHIQLSAEDAATTGGYAKSYTISSPAQQIAGNLGDAYLGDLVLENEKLRVAIARPGKPEMGAVRGGTIMDIVRTDAPVDYLGGINLTMDPSSTSSQVIYENVQLSGVLANTTAILSMSGYVGEPDTPAPALANRIGVSTRYTLAKGSPILQIDTNVVNQTTGTAWIQPADTIDWGEAEVFSEGKGYSVTTAPLNFVLGAVDDFSLGYYTSGTKPMEGLHQGRDSVILASGAIRDLEARVLARKQADQASDQNLAPEYRGFGASTTQEPGMVMFPGTETRYGMGPGGLPEPAPIYVPEARLQIVDGKATVTLPRVRKSLFEAPESESESASIQLERGETYSFTRFLVVSDGNWKPIADNAYAAKDVKLGRLSGVVVEGGSGNRIADATVRISGGTQWNGAGAAPPVLQVKSRKDGSFSAQLPVGKYQLEPVALGRRSAGKNPPVEIESNFKASVSVLQMTKESLLRIAISEAETVTSSPLPVKVTLVSKPPYPTENYGFTPDVSRGVRNTYYLPQGAAVFPVTPGRYRLVISRGVEYDILQKDITVVAGREQTVTGSLPHVMKGLLPAMVSMDAGVVTNASGVGYATAASRAIQAACEGVSIIVSGDYGQVTNLQTAIRNQGLERWVKAFSGRRDLLHKGDLSADLFVYPLDESTSAAYNTAVDSVRSLPPDVALADLKKQVPDLIFEISRPVHPEAGYLEAFAFNMNKKRFIDDNMPPPDFNAIQVLEGKKLGLENEVYSRYMAMQLERLGQNDLFKAPPLSPVGSSFSRLPYGQEIGYPRVYLYLNSDKTLAQVTASDVVSAVRGQHYLVTNGPILLFDALNFDTLEFSVKPGEILDAQTTEIVRIRARVLAAPWITLEGINTRENGLRGITVFGIQPSEKVQRYPTNQSGSHIYTRYLKEDAVLDAYAYSSLRSLAPVVPDALEDFGGAAFPYCMSGPIFVDRNGDGKITINNKEP